MASEYQISAYPKDLASLVRDRWQTGNARECASLPDLTVLEHLISVCYQASLLREEGRPVRFRLIFLAPDRLPPDFGPPVGLHRLLFGDKLPFTQRELRKLSLLRRSAFRCRLWRTFGVANDNSHTDPSITDHR
jgi:hypothetical protein